MMIRLMELLLKTLYESSYVKTVLQNMYEDFQLLRIEVVDNSAVDLEREIGTAIEKLKMNPA